MTNNKNSTEHSGNEPAGETMAESENNTGHKDSQKQVGLSIIWAALIIASSLLIEDNKAATTMLFLLLGGWAATTSYIGGFKKAMECERAIICKFMSLDSSSR